MLTLSLNVDGVQRKTKRLARNAKDVEPALTIFDRYYRARVDWRFASDIDSQGLCDGSGRGGRTHAQPYGSRRRQWQRRVPAGSPHSLETEYVNAGYRLGELFEPNVEASCSDAIGQLEK
jgi:hypothetical protein